jgi:kynurenine 3-monooxygenase
VDRGGLNKQLLDELGSLPNVKLLFNHKLTGADFKKKVAWFEQRGDKISKQGRPSEIEVQFDFLIGADGAHSSARYHLMKFIRMSYRQEYIDTLWCEFQIPPKEHYNTSMPESKFRISPHHLHIWPGKEYMFIAIPSLVSSPSCYSVHDLTPIIKRTGPLLARSSYPLVTLQP